MINSCVICSVCVITILRIAVAAQFDPNGLTYDYLKLLITTVLEPMFPPVLKKILGSEGEHDSPKRGSSSLTRLPSNGMKQSPVFPMLDDSHRFADLETDRSEDFIAGSDGIESSFGIEHSTDSPGETHPYSMINV